MTILYYVHDPMCSWCWAFEPTWEKIRLQLPTDITLKYLLGGLAADTDEIMPIDMQHQIQRYWKTIQQQVPGTRFNFSFWKTCIPRRSTHLACRAVIAAKKQNPQAEFKMIKKIQQAYYLHAENPSDTDVLVSLSSDLGLDTSQFKKDLNHKDTKIVLAEEIKLSQQIGAHGFPSLILKTNKIHHCISIDYNNADISLNSIKELT